jgi:hypothetical protein
MQVLRVVESTGPHSSATSAIEYRDCEWQLHGNGALQIVQMVNGKLPGKCTVMLYAPGAWVSVETTNETE